ncbi:hypothetical protein NL676_019958 [Syzygium grande]|nr:hypothetical protein NL676_019958 [Syzygium grande]
MSAGRWGDIPYNRVASVAMKLHCSWSTMAIGRGASVDADGGGSIQGGEVGELHHGVQCLGEHVGTPMEVSVALGLLVSELSREPWKGKVITFSERPQLHAIQGDDLRSKTEFIRTMEWGCNTNFQSVFDRILEVATAGKLKAEEMVQKVFVFSDMEFDRASSNPWETDYEAIKRKFGERGYGAGVALVSGFSKNLMKMFLEEDGCRSPVAIMEAAISGKKYRDLVVVD